MGESGRSGAATAQEIEIRCPNCNKLIFKAMNEPNIHADLSTVCPRCKRSFIWIRRNNQEARMTLGDGPAETGEQNDRQP